MSFEQIKLPPKSISLSEADAFFKKKNPSIVETLNKQTTSNTINGVPFKIANLDINFDISNPNKVRDKLKITDMSKEEFTALFISCNLPEFTKIDDQGTIDASITCRFYYKNYPESFKKLMNYRLNSIEQVHGNLPFIQNLRRIFGLNNN